MKIGGAVFLLVVLIAQAAGNDKSGTEAPAYTDADITGRVPMGRFATPEILHFADERESGYINGHMLAVDGGRIADGSWEWLRKRHR